MMEFFPMLENNNSSFELNFKRIEKAGYKPGEDYGLQLIVLLSQFIMEKEKLYKLKSAKKQYSSDELMITG